MKKALCSIVLIALTCLHSVGGQPWKGRFISKENQLNLVIDLYEESISVPGLDMFGPMNGYVNGRGIYNVWYITSFKIIDEQHATMRVSNDLGSEAQALELTYVNDSTLTFRQVDGNVMKKVVGRKLQKIPVSMDLTKVK